MKLALILPDNIGWRSEARAGNFSRALSYLGYEFDIYFCKRDSNPANVTGYSIVFNHALQATPKVLHNVASAHEGVQIVHVNHSSIGHIESSGDRLIKRICEVVNAAKRSNRIWLASVDQSSQDMLAGCDQWLQLPIPLSELHGTKEKALPLRPVVVLAGRVDAVKNQINQLIACKHLANKIEIHLCLSPTPWMTNVMRSLGIVPKMHGLMKHREWMRFLQTKASVLLQCSYTESFNITACEAMQCGVPVVTTDSVWFADKKLICNPNDVKSIAEKVELAIDGYPENSALASSIGSSTAQWTRETYQQAIEKVLANRLF